MAEAEEEEAAEVAEAQLHGAVRVPMVEAVVEVEDQSSALVVEGHTMLMRVRIGNNNDCIIRWKTVSCSRRNNFITNSIFIDSS